jgi:hypothetical protein
MEEYCTWYLRREASKEQREPANWELTEPVTNMRRHHGGKMRPWFDATTRWRIAELNAETDLACLVFLEDDWTKGAKLVVPGRPDYRILKQVASNAKQMDYLGRLARLIRYYEGLQRDAFRLEGPNRIAVCSAEPCEMLTNPSARYYLLDGAGRCLAYMLLLLENKAESKPVEAFVAERSA